MQFSQSSIKNLVHDLAQLQQNITNGGTASAQALSDALAPLNTALARIDGDTTVAGSFRKETADAVAALIGAGTPESLNTLKEIADYIAVNPNASVADAIHQAIADAHQATLDLTTAVNAEKAFSDYKSLKEFHFASEDFSFGATDVLLNSQAMINPQYAIDTVLNFGFARLTNTVTNTTYDLPVIVGEGVAINFAGYESEAANLSEFTGRIQYSYKSLTTRDDYLAQLNA